MIGNHTVHPGQIDMKDNKEIAIKLFGLLNMVVHEMITVPKETDRIFDIIPEKEKLNIKKEITSKSFNSFYIKL